MFQYEDQNEIAMSFTNVFRTLATRPRSSTKGPLDADDGAGAGTVAGPSHGPLTSPIPSQAARFSSAQAASPRSSLNLSRASPAPRSPAPRSPALNAVKDFSFLLRPEIYHQLSPLSVPTPFRSPARQPAPETLIPALLSQGHFRAAAIAAVQALTSSPVSAVAAAAHPPVDPSDHARVFELLYTRLACLCLIDATSLAAQESKALEDLNSAFYLDPLTGAHLVPWELRVLGVRLQAIGFGDPRRAVMSYYELAREARTQLARAGKRGEEGRVWRERLEELGVKVAGALIEMDDLDGAAEHLATLGDTDAANDGKGRLAMSRALLWLHLGDVEAARRCVRSAEDEAESTSERIVNALADMADGEYKTALEEWEALKSTMEENGEHDEMVGVNLAVCLLYTGKMAEAKEVLEGLVDAGDTSHTLLFNLTTMYELCTDRHKNLKMKLAERVASKKPSQLGWEKTNADFKL